jgi:hypothetical protein
MSMSKALSGGRREVPGTERILRVRFRAMSDLLLRGGRPWGLDEPADVLVRHGQIEQI